MTAVTTANPIGPRVVDRATIVPLLLVGGVISLSLGARSLGWSDLIAGNGEAWRILALSRLPRLLSVLLVGAGLAVSGLILQLLMRNRFASPGTAATIDGARVGFVISVLLLPSAVPMVRIGIAAAGAIAATAVFVLLVSRLRYRSVAVVPLTGLVLGSILDAGAEGLAYRFDMVQSVSSWLVGDFSMIVSGRYEILLVTIPLVVVAYLMARRFMIAGLGKETASGLGLDYGTTVAVAVLIVAGITATAVVVAGEVPFVGLVVPNLISLARGDNLQHTLPETALLGGLFLLLSDVVSRVVIAPYEVPIGLTVGVLGSVAFISILLRGRIHGTE